MNKIKIIVVEDNKEIREMMQAFFNLQDDMEVIKTYANGNLFLEEFKHEKCDIVIMDINMPGKTGVECIELANNIREDAKFIISTSFENYEYIFQALCAGATGYIVKSEKADNLVSAIREVIQGGSPMSPQIARLVVSSFRKSIVKTDALDQLSKREKDIISNLSQGLKYTEISEKLFISPQTVRTHIRNIYEKLQVKSKTDAINKVFPRQ